METLADFHPTIQCAVRYLAQPDLTLESLGQELGITRQAVYKKVQSAAAYLKSYSPPGTIPPAPDPAVLRLTLEVSKLTDLVGQLRRQLTLKCVTIFLLEVFQERVLRFFSRFKLSRLKAREKLYCLQMLEKFLAQGGSIKDFAKAIGRSTETLLRWKNAYRTQGLAGLTDKITRPKSLGNKVPAWIKEHLVALFFQFPCWTPYQYHSYLKHNPAIHWYVSLPTIQKLKIMTTSRSQAEKERLRKRWCFQKGTKAWTVDFTCILKTDHYKLQLLTVSDARSRFLFETALFLETSTELVVDHLVELFSKYGKPDFVKADNGPEFRTECEDQLRDLCVNLLNSPRYYGQFCGAHERIHRTLKTQISDFEKHKNITRLVQEIGSFREQYNQDMPHEYLEGKTPAEVLLTGEDFVPKNAEVVEPYRKDGEIRMKFTNRDGNMARLSIDIIPEPDNLSPSP